MPKVRSFLDDDPSYHSFISLPARNDLKAMGIEGIIHHPEALPLLSRTIQKDVNESLGLPTDFEHTSFVYVSPEDPPLLASGGLRYAPSKTLASEVMPRGFGAETLLQREQSVGNRILEISIDTDAMLIGGTIPQPALGRVGLRNLVLEGIIRAMVRPNPPLTEQTTHRLRPIPEIEKALTAQSQDLVTDLAANHQEAVWLLWDRSRYPHHEVERD